MPMGITADIYEGEDVSLRDYLMRVGRHMGYAILQRDDDPDAEVKPTEASTSYYDRRIPESEARLAVLRTILPEEAEADAEADYLERLDGWRKRRDDKQALRERYEDMLRQVEAWEPDPLVASTKEHALGYLRESIDFDCSMKYDEEPQRVPGDQWVAEQIAHEERALASARTHRREEIERTVERNRYIDAFRASLPPAEEEAAA